MSTDPANRESSRLNCLHHGLIDCWDEHVEHQVCTDILGHLLSALQLLTHFLTDVGEGDTVGKLRVYRFSGTDVVTFLRNFLICSYLKIIFVS